MDRNTRFRRRQAIGIAALIVAGATAVTYLRHGSTAEAEAAKVNARDGVAIDGYDPVAYFADGRPVPGRPEHSVEHGGVRWLFSTEAHRDAFLADPERYRPQYGGFCAYAVANGQFAKIDPEAWSIEGGRLYLNYDLSIRDRWLGDVDGYIRRADENWPAMQIENP